MHLITVLFALIHLTIKANSITAPPQKTLLKTLPNNNHNNPPTSSSSSPHITLTSKFTNLRKTYSDRLNFVKNTSPLPFPQTKTTTDTTSFRESSLDRTTMPPHPNPHPTARKFGDSQVQNPDDYSFIVSLSTPFGSFCGGSLIAPNLVLTAAHCVVDLPFNFFVEIGRFKLGDDIEDGVIRRSVRNVISHVCYDGSNDKSDDLSYDIAILQLSEDVVIDLNDATGVRLVELYSGAPTLLIPSPPTLLTVIIWGNNTQDTYISRDKNNVTIFPSILHEVSVPYISNAECASIYGQFVTGSMICATRESEGEDSCQVTSDGGGPLFVKVNDTSSSPPTFKALQVGVMSWGNSCGLPNLPGVYSSISAAYEWLQGYIDGIRMNAVEVAKGAHSCPLRMNPGSPFPSSYSYSHSYSYDDHNTHGNEPFDNVDCKGTSFSDPYLSWAGDCFCDDSISIYGLDLNCAEFNFDNGDCDAVNPTICPDPDPPNSTNTNTTASPSPTSFPSLSPTSSSSSSPSALQSCENFSCQENRTESCVDEMIGSWKWLADGFCDKDLNCLLYNYDEGDCQGICDNISCLDNTVCLDDLTLQKAGDGTCNAELNCAAFNYDQGDCCMLSGCNGDCKDEFSHFVGDGICDAIFNCHEHSYDSEDCKPCTNVSCKDKKVCMDDFTATIIGNSMCNVEMNCVAYNFDNGDCTSDNADQVCANRDCLNLECIDAIMESYSGDGQCDSRLNCNKYQYDNYDCNECQPPLHSRLSCVMNSNTALFDSTVALFTSSDCLGSEKISQNTVFGGISHAVTGNIVEFGMCLPHEVGSEIYECVNNEVQVSVFNTTQCQNGHGPNPNANANARSIERYPRTCTAAHKQVCSFLPEPESLTTTTVAIVGPSISIFEGPGYEYSDKFVTMSCDSSAGTTTTSINNYENGSECGAINATVRQTNSLTQHYDSAVFGYKYNECTPMIESTSNVNDFFFTGKLSDTVTMCDNISSQIECNDQRCCRHNNNQCTAIESGRCQFNFVKPTCANGFPIIEVWKDNTCSREIMKVKNSIGNKCIKLINDDDAFNYGQYTLSPSPAASSFMVIESTIEFKGVAESYMSAVTNVVNFYDALKISIANVLEVYNFKNFDVDIKQFKFTSVDSRARERQSLNTEEQLLSITFDVTLDITNVGLDNENTYFLAFNSKLAGAVLNGSVLADLIESLDDNVLFGEVTVVDFRAATEFTKFTGAGGKPGGVSGASDGAVKPVKWIFGVGIVLLLLL